MKLLANGSVGFVARAPSAWRATTRAAHAWRGITLKEWTVASTVGFVYFLLSVVSVLPAVAGAVEELGGSKAWDAQSFVGTAVMGFAGAYCFLLAVRLAEAGAVGGIATRRRYVVAGVVAVAAAFPALLAASYVFHPCRCENEVESLRSAIGPAVFHASDIALTGGLALAVYVRLKSARAARSAFHAAELARAAVDREVLASRLAVMQARVEPQFLLSTLAQVERLYDRSPPAAASMLDSLITYLRTALPQLRGESSTLGCEVQLASSYLDIVRARAGGHLDFAFDIPIQLGHEAFPPLVMLPLVEDAINGIESDADGRIDVHARAIGEYLSVSVADNGLQREPGEAVTAVATRLRAMYGDDAQMTRMPNSPSGVVITVEVPLAAGDHR